MGRQGEGREVMEMGDREWLGRVRQNDGWTGTRGREKEGGKDRESVRRREGGSDGEREGGRDRGSVREGQ